MGKKRRRSVSLDADLDEWLGNQSNVSGLVNDLIRHYQSGGSIQDAALGKRIAELEREIEDIDAEIARLKTRRSGLVDERNSLEKKLDSRMDDLENAVDDWMALAQPPALVPDNPAVENHAGKAGVTPEQFIDAVRSRRSGQNE